MCSNKNCLNTLQYVLKQSNNKNKFINIQNNEGQTALLLSVLNNNFEMAYILEKSGANKKIKDNFGNYVESDEPEEKMSELDKDIEKSITDISDLLSVEKQSSPINNTNIFIIEPHDNGNVNNNYSDLKTTSLPITLSTLTTKSTTPELSSLDLSTEDFINSLSERYNTSKSITTDFDTSEKPTIHKSTKIISDLSETSPLLDRNYGKLSDTSPLLSSTSSMDSYLDRASKELDQKIKPVETFSSIDTDDLIKGIEKRRQDEFESSIDTDKLIEAIEGKEKEETRQMGGKDIFKTVEMMGGSHKKKSKKNKKLLKDEYTDSEDNITNNYLARLVRSKKDEFHEQVLQMIKDLLKDGKFYRGSEQIDDNERNALLIKRFLYRYLSEKNPELSGMDKILNIKNMTESEMVKLVKNIPDLDDLEKQIQQHLTEKSKNKLKSNSKSESESSDSVSSNSESESVSKSEKKKKKKK
jgi:hypothetical protein